MAASDYSLWLSRTGLNNLFLSAFIVSKAFRLQVLSHWTLTIYLTWRVWCQTSCRCATEAKPL